jgi:prepilin-type N-terminal cleavage/methylation domain-containing protein
MKLKLKLKSRRGYTIAEFMVAMTIIGILAVVLGVVMPQMTSIPEKGENQMDALHSLQSAIHYVSLDAGSAVSAVGGGSLTLTMPDDSVISYTKTGDILYRNGDGANQTVARNITGLNFTVDERLVTMDITAAPEGRWDISESRIYRIAMRPSGI